MRSGIYCITNIADGTIYIGSSKNCPRRWTEHRGELRKNRHCNRHLQSAWNKYGEGCFSFAIIEQCAESELYAKEQQHLDRMHQQPGVSSYNLSPIAKGSSMSAGARKQMSERLKGNTYTLGRKLTTEEREHLSKVRKGVPKNPASRPNYVAAALKRESWRKEIPELPYVEPDWLKGHKNAGR